MQNPFPGMNPYLEQPELWHQVHNRLIVAIADELTPQIVPQYRVSIEERIYMSVDNILLVGIADVAVTKRSNTQTTRTTVKVPLPEEVIERYLEIRLTSSKELITVIEILSPKNKRSKEGRTAYESKRQKIFGSSTHLVEIDLLRQGEPMLVLGEIDTDYRILISRSYCRPDADLYTFNLKDPIPLFSVPLQQGESEPILDLQKLLNDVYHRARFDLAIDYSQPVKPTLSDEEIAWIDKILKKVSC